MRWSDELERRSKAKMRNSHRTCQPPEKRRYKRRAAPPPAFFARVARERASGQTEPQVDLGGARRPASANRELRPGLIDGEPSRDRVGMEQGVPEGAGSVSRHRDRGCGRKVRRSGSGRQIHAQAGAAHSRVGQDEAVRRSVHRRWPNRQDFKPAQLAKDRKLAREGYARSKGLMRRDGGYLDPGPLTSILDQDAAVQARLWFERQTIRATYRHERQPRPEGRWWHTFFLTVILPSGIVAPGQLHTTDLTKLRKALQRYARALPEGSFAGGMLEADYVVDHCAGVEHWQWHCHFIVVVPCRGPARGRPLVRRAFPVRADRARGVYLPVQMKSVRTSLGGLRGAVEYSSKTLQIHGVHRKVITLNAKTGRRGKAQRQHLSPEQLAEWAAFVATVQADSLMVWSGYRRYADGLVPTTGHGGGRKRDMKM